VFALIIPCTAMVNLVWYIKKKSGHVQGIGQAHVNYILRLRMFENISRERIVPVQNIDEKVRRGSIYP